MEKKKRVVTKIGDVFAVNVNDKTRKFFQLIAFDLTQLNSGYHDVFVYKGKVIDKMSKFRDKPVPFKQWVRTFDPQSAKNPEGVLTILTRIN